MKSFRFLASTTVDGKFWSGAGSQRWRAAASLVGAGAGVAGELGLGARQQCVSGLEG